MFINKEDIKGKMVGKAVAAPSSGEISGHAAGSPLQEALYSVIKKGTDKEKAYHQYEYLNKIYQKHPEAKKYSDRKALLPSDIEFLLSRGKSATEKWSLSSQFKTKQNDTADMLITNDKKFDLIDAKTSNMNKRGQPPNIISSYKVAKVCKIMIDKKQFNNFTLNYIQIDWDKDDTVLVCRDIHFAELFKIPPSKLYINWAAATQIQFHVNEVDQSFNNTTETWCKEYLEVFKQSAQTRIDKMKKQYIEPF